MKTYGLQGLKDRPEGKERWFDLVLTPFYGTVARQTGCGVATSGAFLVAAGSPEHDSISAILEASAAAGDAQLARHRTQWKELQVPPSKPDPRPPTEHGIYYIVDATDGKGHVGAAYGDDNLLGRWMNYADRGHGGDVLLRSRNQEQFSLSIWSAFHRTWEAPT